MATKEKKKSGKSHSDDQIYSLPQPIDDLIGPDLCKLPSCP
jgi:hypothetical protein